MLPVDDGVVVICVVVGTVVVSVVICVAVVVIGSVEMGSFPPKIVMIKNYIYYTTDSYLILKRPSNVVGNVKYDHPDLKFS